MLVKNLTTVLIWSENYKALVDWYIEKFDLAIETAINHPDDTGRAFLIGNTRLWIGQHSKVHGKNSDIHRHMFNFAVDSVSATYEELKKRGVRFLAEPFKAPTMDKYFATFYDLDNNLGQIVGPK